MKHFADNNRREVSFQECDWVMVKLRPYRQSSVIGPNPTKLSKRYYGLFKVLDRIRTVAYKLLLPEGSHIHPIFHCSLLKPFLHDAANEPRPLLLLGKDMENLVNATLVQCSLHPLKLEKRTEPPTTSPGVP